MTYKHAANSFQISASIQPRKSPRSELQVSYTLQSRHLDRKPSWSPQFRYIIYMKYHITKSIILVLLHVMSGILTLLCFDAYVLTKCLVAGLSERSLTEWSTPLRTPSAVPFPKSAASDDISGLTTAIKDSFEIRWSSC